MGRLVINAESTDPNFSATVNQDLRTLGVNWAHYVRGMWMVRDPQDRAATWWRDRSRTWNADRVIVFDIDDDHWAAMAPVAAGDWLGRNWDPDR